MSEFSHYSVLLNECIEGLNIKPDGIYVDGNDIYYSWQNVSEAESTMFIKVSTGIIGSLLVLPFAPMILPFVGAYAVLVLLTSAIL